jgi:mitogen-activated protein kinase 1/3
MIVSFLLQGNVFEVYERYQNLTPIGSGAYGLVCSADDSVHILFFFTFINDPQKKNKRVAIKKVSDTFSDLIDAKRILRELKLLRHFTSQGHENIIAILDIFTMPPNEPNFNDVYIVTDLMESDLQKIVSSKQSLTEAHIRYFLYEIFRGLKFVHSANVLHRDLKPR